MKKNLAIIVLNYNNYELTYDCVKGLEDIGVNFPIIIVDNNSLNNSFEFLKDKFKTYDNIHVIKNLVNSGYANGNNYGIRYALDNINNLDYIAIMNPDVKITYKEIFYNLMSKLSENEDIAGITGIMINNRDINLYGTFWDIPKNIDVILNYSTIIRKIRDLRKKKILKVKENFDNIAYAGVITGSFFIIKKNIFEKVGFFDVNTFLYNEENILAIKLKNIGYQLSVSINDYFFHNHIYTTKLNLKGKLKIEKILFDSTKYLIKNYYDKNLIIFLYLIRFIKIIEIIIFYLKERVRKGSNK
ncbi:glycosyltransferase [Clostridium perfringens]|uniref:glycosyltransferase n=1 Tax=Clostridium perfringens TaxID=1502 RepID=UPI0024690133|nr:glycosyltransferase [Clostridium perfringens]MDH5068015.1 N-glycosyltransferase [Clostridium perfringens]